MPSLPLNRHQVKVNALQGTSFILCHDPERSRAQFIKNLVKPRTRERRKLNPKNKDKTKCFH